MQTEMARRKELDYFASKALNITCFTSKLKCSRCGCSYVCNQRANRTKHTSTYKNTIVVWGCDTQKKKGDRCSNKDIPERILREAYAAALNLEVFDEDISLERVEIIQVKDRQVLKFHFYNGTSNCQVKCNSLVERINKRNKSKVQLGHWNAVRNSNLLCRANTPRNDDRP